MQVLPSLAHRYCLSLGLLVVTLSSVSVARAQDEGSENVPEQPAAESTPTPAAPVPAPARKKKERSVGERNKLLPAATKQPSFFFPDWKPNALGFGLRPVLGFQYSSDSASDSRVGQAEFGLYGFAKGINVVPGNPGVQIEPGFGYALGASSVQKGSEGTKTGNYRRIWGGLQTPVYYRFVRQLFGVNYGLVSGGPIPVSRRFQFVSDTGVAILPLISGHYTLTYDRTFGENDSFPELNSYDHWLHGRLSTNLLNFFIDAGPGYSTSILSASMDSSSSESTSSETYFLARSGLDLLTDKIGLDAQAKYIFSATSRPSLIGGGYRSPLDDLGGDAQRVGLPEDSLHVSAFFGLRRIFAGVGIGWRYSLEILNLNERNGTKTQKTESNGLGLFASVNF